MKILNYGSLNIDYTYSVDHFVRGGETMSSEEMHVFSDPNLHHLPGDALRLVDAHHHRPAAVPVHCDPGGGQPQPAAPQL